MTSRITLIAALIPSALAFSACNDDVVPTQPGAVAESPGTPDFAFTANSWAKKANVLTPRSRHVAAVANKTGGLPVLYVIGGIDTAAQFNQRTTKVDAYDVATNSWSAKAPMPEGLLSMNGVGLIDGKLYIPGGSANFGDGAEVVPYLYVYDTRTNSWTRKADLPRLITDGVTGVINGKLYVLTGRCANCTHQITHRLYRYDPATNKWNTSLPWAPQSHVEGAGGVINGKFYVAGGIGRDGRITNQLQVYDPVTNKWSTKASMPSVQAYDPVRNTWTTKASMPTGRRYLAAARATLDGQSRIFAVGGLGTQTSPQANEAYSP